MFDDLIEKYPLQSGYVTVVNGTERPELVVAQRLCELSGNDKLFAWVRRGILNTVKDGNEFWDDDNLRLVNVPTEKLVWAKSGESFQEFWHAFVANYKGNRKLNPEWVRYDFMVNACAEQGDTLILI